MGWHCITVWECELKPSRREETLESIAFTLNHIWLQDHTIEREPRIAQIPRIEESGTSMAAEDLKEPERILGKD